MGVSLATDRTQEDVLSTPQPGENLAKFYARSKDYWTNKAFETIGANNRGKELRRDGFSLAEEAFRAFSSNCSGLRRRANVVLVYTEQYQPLLEEIMRIQAQAGLDADELSKGGRAGGLGAESRNRR